MSQARTLEELASDDYQKTISKFTREELNQNLKKIIIDAFALESLTKFKCDYNEDDIEFIDYDKIIANVPPVSNSIEIQKILNSVFLIFDKVCKVRSHDLLFRMSNDSNKYQFFLRAALARDSHFFLQYNPQIRCDVDFDVDRICLTITPPGTTNGVVLVCNDPEVLQQIQTDVLKKIDDQKINEPWQLQILHGYEDYNIIKSFLLHSAAIKWRIAYVYDTIGYEEDVRYSTFVTYFSTLIKKVFKPMQKKSICDNNLYATSFTDRTLF